MTYEIYKTKFGRFQLVRKLDFYPICSSSDEKDMKTLKKDIERRLKKRHSEKNPKQL